MVLLTSSCEDARQAQVATAHTLDTAEVKLSCKRICSHDAAGGWYSTAFACIAGPVQSL